MICMICRNRVTNYVKWREVFDSHAEDHQHSGLSLLNLLRDLEDPNNVFFNFEVTDMERAKSFIS